MHESCAKSRKVKKKGFVVNNTCSKLAYNKQAKLSTFTLLFSVDFDFFSLFFRDILTM